MSLLEEKGFSMDYEHLPRSALIQMLQEHDEALKDAGKDGIIMNYTGRTAPWEIIHQVKPKLNHIIKRSSIGDESVQSQNEIWDGENLSTMVTLYKYHSQVDLILTDPPYNTGEDFRYNDKWDHDPNDPDLGALVPADDGSRHSKWLKFMTPRIWMMREMLKPGGVMAICIDHRELYRLGMLMDEIFGEKNRIGIINWQKSYSPKNDTGGKNGGLSTGTEYVLVYARNSERAKTGLLGRTEVMDSKYRNPDGDEDGDWKSSDPTAASGDKKAAYGIQSPFTGKLYYPGARYWVSSRSNMRSWAEGWGSKYVDQDIGDGVVQTNKQGGKTVVKALVLEGCKFHEGMPISNQRVLIEARKSAEKILSIGRWPKLYWGLTGETGPQLKHRMSEVKKGRVPMTYWANEDYAIPLDIGNQSWDHQESGHSQAGINELDAVVGKGHNFKTVKPLRLIKKIIQLWCPPEGLVLDTFAGSGTTGHAVLELNQEAGTSRRFILIEQGNTEKGDHYARTLTAERVRRVITGDWKSGRREPIPGGFRFIELQRGGIDADAVNALAREEMIDLLLTSYWDKAESAKSYLQRRTVNTDFRYLFAVNVKQEGFFLIWDSPENSSILDQETFKRIVREAKLENLEPLYHVYAAIAPYTGAGIEFYKIPDKVLEHVGFNLRSDAFHSEETTNV